MVCANHHSLSPSTPNLAVIASVCAMQSFSRLEYGTEQCQVNTDTCRYDAVLVVPQSGAHGEHLLTEGPPVVPVHEVGADRNTARVRARGVPPAAWNEDRLTRPEHDGHRRGL